MSRSLVKLIFPVLLAVFAVVWFTRSGAPPPGTAPTTAASAADGGAADPGGILLIEGLKAGDAVGDWQISRIVMSESNEKKPQLAIELERKGSGITIWIARKENAKNPPLTTQKYALSFGHARPYGDPIPEGSYETTMQKIAERVRRAEPTAPIPPGL